MTATQAPTPGPLSGDDELNVLLDRAVAAFQALPLEEQRRQIDDQKRRWVAAEMAMGDEGTRLALAPTAPVEASGSFEERAVMLTKKHGNPVGTDYEQGQNDMGYRMVTMAREADAVIAALRPQPSGETRALIGRLTKALDDATRLPGVNFKPDVSCDDLRAILSLLSVRPAPVASGGQHSSGEGWQGMETAPQDGSKVDLWGYWSETGTWKRSADASWDDERCDWKADGWYAGQYLHPPRWTHWRAVNGPSDTTPACAPVAETAGEAVAWEVWDNPKGPIYLTRVKSELFAWTHNRPLYAAPVPAQDDDKLRELADRVTAEVKRGADGSHVQALGALSNIEELVLAALKSTAAQEGGE